MNKLDLDYQELLKDIIKNGTEKVSRNGGTKSVFGRQIRHNMSEGFPLLTTKKMPWKVIVTELMWFLKGDTNIKYLVENGCNIWNGDCYQAYLKEMGRGKHGAWFDKGQFVDKIKTDDEFAKKWGDLGPIYGKQWRHWGGYVKTPMFGWIKKDDDGIWLMHWGDTNGGFGGHDDCCHTPIKDYDHLTDEDIDKRVEFEFEADYETFQPHKYAIIIKESKDIWVNHVDQIANAIDQLRNNPDSRRIMVNAWNVSEIGNMTLPPCHYGFQLYTRELTENERANIFDSKLFDYRMNKWTPKEQHDKAGIPTRAISLMWNQRSVDTFLGLPFNIASYGLLLEIIAKEVNMIPDELIGNLGDVHLYSNHLEQAKEQIGKELTWEERRNIAEETLSKNEFQGQGIQGDKGYWQGFGYISPFTDKMIHRWLDNKGIPKKTRKPFELPNLIINDEFWNPDRTPETFDWTIEGMEISDFHITNYKSHPSIKAPLSN
jgi:thymidylate synthase